MAAGAGVMERARATAARVLVIAVGVELTSGSPASAMAGLAESAEAERVYARVMRLGGVPAAGWDGALGWRGELGASIISISPIAIWAWSPAAAVARVIGAVGVQISATSISSSSEESEAELAA